MTCQCEEGKCEHCLNLESHVEDMEHDNTVMTEYLWELYANEDRITALKAMMGEVWTEEVFKFLTFDWSEMETDDDDETPVEPHFVLEV